MWRDLRSLLGDVFRQRNHGSLGPPKVMKNGFGSATTLPGSTGLPFVISTEAQRSGEISVWMLFLGNVFERSDTRISYFALLETTTCAARRKESRMQLNYATFLDRKSGCVGMTILLRSTTSIEPRQYALDNQAGFKIG